ncbi:chaperone protein dnaJ 11, chloroplastic-like [Fagus crenata]
MISIATSSSFSSANFVSPKVIASNSNSNSIKSRSLRISASCTSTAERTGSYTTSSSSASSLYEVLGIQAGATCQEIKTAYRRLARVVHPDVSSNGQRGCQTSAGEFMKVHDAYATLSDPEKRADYDRVLYSQGRRTVSSPLATSTSTVTMDSRFAGYTRRKWETDQCW